MHRQNQILEVFNNDKELILSKAEIMTKGNICYYANSEKYLGDTLTRMVKNNSLERVKRGYYKLYQPKVEIDPNQITIFDQGA